MALPAIVSTGITATDVIPLMGSDSVQGRNNMRDIRMQLLLPFLSPGAAEMTVRPGWLPRSYDTAGQQYVSGKLLAQSTADGTCRMYPGANVVVKSGQGPYLTTYESTISSIGFPTVDGTNPRYDLLYSRTYDKTVSGETLNDGRLEIQPGEALGSPQVPPLPNSGDSCAVVAAVLRSATSNTITTAMISDLRRAAGLLGGVRPMMPGDSVSLPSWNVTDTGLFHGELRSRKTPSGLAALPGVPPFLLDIWDAIAGVWRGTQSLEFDVRLTAPGTISAGATRTAAAYTIPDPGWPYRISAGASVRCSGMPASTSHNASMQLRVGTAAPASSYDDTVCSTGTCASASSGGNGYWSAAFATAARVWNGSQTLYKLVTNSTTSTITVVGSDEPYDKLTIRLDPA